MSIVPEPSIPVRQRIRSPALIRLSAAATRVATLTWPARVMAISGTWTTEHISLRSTGAWNPGRRDTRMIRKLTSSTRAERSASSSTTSACSMITRAPTSRAIAWAWRTMLLVNSLHGTCHHGFTGGAGRSIGCGGRLQRDLEDAQVVEPGRIAGDPGLLDPEDVLAGLEQVLGDRDPDPLGRLVGGRDVAVDVIDPLAVERDVGPQLALVTRFE